MLIRRLIWTENWTTEREETIVFDEVNMEESLIPVNGNNLMNLRRAYKPLKKVDLDVSSNIIKIRRSRNGRKYRLCQFPICLTANRPVIPSSEDAYSVWVVLVFSALLLFYPLLYGYKVMNVLKYNTSYHVAVLEMKQTLTQIITCSRNIYQTKKVQKEH